MLDNLKLLNTMVGMTTPEMLFTLTPAELNYMLAGGAQRSLNQTIDQIMANQITAPVVLVDDSSGDTELLDRLKERQTKLNNLMNPAEQQDKQHETQRFADMFVFKKGGSRK